MSENLKWKLVARFLGSCLAIVLALGMTSCEQSTATTPTSAVNPALTNPLATTDGPLAEVNIPASIVRLAPSLEKFQPQVQILSPQPDQILNDDLVSVKLQVRDLPLFKSAELGLGNHLHVILDKQTYQGVYDLTQPVVFKNLAAGTHTIRVFAARPWHESFKNAGAYAQTTFHVLTKTAENNPDPQQPLLTYSRPTGTYGAEPIMLDYYLINAPAHVVTNSTPESIPDWRIRATVNSQQFIIDRWTPIYLQGFKPGKNWVRLELVDDRGNPIPNIYNDTTSIITYDPQSKDAIAKLVRGEIDPDLARTLVDPNYIAAKPTPTPIPPSIALPTPIQPPAIVTAPPPLKPVPKPVATATPQPTPIPSPVAAAPPQLIPSPSPSPVIVATPQPIPSPNPVVILPQPIPSPKPVATATPQPIPVPSPSPVIIPTLPPIPSPSPVVIVPQPLPIPIPVVLVQPQPAASPHPTPAPIPTPAPVQLQPIVQPPSSPAPAPTLVIPSPTPSFTPQPAPVATPMPTVTTSPVAAIPQPLIPSPAPNPVIIAPPTNAPFQPATSIRQAPTNVITPPSTPTLAPQNPLPIADPASTPQVEQPEQPTWQTKAIELIQFAGVKIREFTNTIPAKSQRFGQNVQVWAGRAIDTIRSWRNNGAG